MSIFSALVILILIFIILKKTIFSSRNSSSILIPTITGPGNYSVEAVGESNYQQQLEQICGKRTATGVDLEIAAKLILEHSNPHDSQAVAIHINNLIVGYLDRPTARSFRKSVRKAGYQSHVTFQCSARIRGGWDRGYSDSGLYGVRIDLPTT